jgi:replicative DNA helicase
MAQPQPKLVDPPETPVRIPPRNIEAEMALLGAILINNQAFEKVSEFLKPEHFYDPLHGRIFATIAMVVEQRRPADPTTLRHHFENDPEFAEYGGVQYLARMARAAVTIINAEHYGRIIHDLHLKRELIAIGTDTVNEAFDGQPDDTAIRQVERAEQRLYELATTGDYEGGFQPFKVSLKGALELAEHAYKRAGGISGIASGLDELDRVLGGLHPSDLIVLAGRPAMGKTALATNIAFNAARDRARAIREGQAPRVDGAVVGFFSLEMSSEQLAMRMLAEESGVPSDQIRRSRLTNEDFDKFVRASQELQAAPFFIDDTPGLSVSALRTRARRLKRQHGLSMIVVDYLQLVQAGGAQRYDNRVQEVSEITRGLKLLAKELEVPVIALSQLSRQVESREDNRPQLSDLRESGAIEQDADVVMFIYRKEYYWKKDHPQPRWNERFESHDVFQAKMETWEREYREDGQKGVAEVIIGKNRHGSTETVSLYFNERLTKFGNLIADDHTPEGASSGAPF